MSFSRSNLRFSYSWIAISGDNPKISGKPDSTLFNRNEGYEVLYLINKVLNLKRISGAESGQKIERMIRDIPSNYRSQANLIDWINANWFLLK